MSIYLVGQPFNEDSTVHACICTYVTNVTTKKNFAETFGEKKGVFDSKCRQIMQSYLKTIKHWYSRKSQLFPPKIGESRQTLRSYH
jgi:hypothetical protein